MPSARVTVDEVCATSVTLLVVIYTNQSTCRFYSYHLYLMSSGKTLPSASNNNSHYRFNKLAANTNHNINVTVIHGVTVNTVLDGFANTAVSLRKFPSSHTLQILRYYDNAT